jgi:hypothetical protein
MLGRDRDGVIGYLTREAWGENKFNQRYHHHIAVPPREEAA